MKALLYGVKPEPMPVPETDNHLLRSLAQTPMKLVEMDEPGFFLPDWVVTRPRLTGICGSDSKQVFMDWGEVRSPDNPMKGFFSLPQVLGHEVVSDVVALGPEAEGLEVGDRVVLNPWLSCGPRGVTPLCPACEVGDFSLCYSFDVGPIPPGIHIGTARDVNGGYAQVMSAHDSQLHKVPDNVSDELAVFADPFAVSLHSITRHPPKPGGKVMVYGAGALGTSATAILRALYPDVEVLVVARFEAQAEMARKLGAKVIGHSPASQVIEEAAAWSGGILRASDGLPMTFPGFIDVVYDTVGKQETFEVGTRVLAARGTLVKAGVHGPTWWEDTPLYFKEISMVGSNAFGFETVEGVRKHGIDHYLDLVSSGRIDLTGMLTHTYPLDAWRDAFTTLATQDESGAIKVAFDYRSAVMSDVVLVDISDRVAVITLNRPDQRNALNRDVRRELPAAITRCDTDEAVDVMILTGADPAFSAGVDLKEFGSGQVQQGESFGGVAETRDAFRGALPVHTKPLIGAVNGVAVTGGFEVALNCDFIVASDRARFADTHARVGVMPGWGLTVLLAQRIGVARAKQMSFTGNYIDAQTACDWGLVNEVVPHDELLAHCRKLAADIVSNDQMGVRRMLRTYDEVSATTVDEGWEIEARVSREWEGPGFDPASIESRRMKIVERGRSQIQP